MKQTGIFGKLRVLELASVLAGPAVGQFFAELGADVVKVEQPVTGDITRSWRTPGEEQEISAYFSAVNWGKRSIALNLRDEADRDILFQLIARADIVVASFRPGADKELGLDYPSLVRRHPGLIYGQITGYGPSSPRVGYDAVLQAETGFMYLNSTPEGRPQKMPVALIDILAAHQLKEAILVALINRIESGEGACVSVSLRDAAISSLANQGANYLTGGKDPSPTGSLHPNISPYGEVVTSGDGRQIVLAVGSDRQFKCLAAFKDLEGLVRDPRFASNTQRVKHRSELFGILQETIGRHSAGTFLSFCLENHIPAGEICSAGQAISSSGEILISHENMDGIRTFIAAGLQVEEELTGPPTLNAHAAEILSDWLARGH